jgi:hypothetical protein
MAAMVRGNARCLLTRRTVASPTRSIASKALESNRRRTKRLTLERSDFP